MTKRWSWLRTMVLLSLVSSLLGSVPAMPLSAQGSNYGLQFNGTNDYVDFGSATVQLGVTTFTLEAWVNRGSGGQTMTTGSLGLDGSNGRPLAYPVLTKGMGQGESPANINMNFFLGIAATGAIGADFEDNAGGINHPVWGNTPVPIGEWHHIAATYDGACWRLYLDGIADAMNGTTCPNATPESTSAQHGALAAGLSTTGAPGTGYFAGAIDEARVWRYARTLTEIQSTINSEIDTPQTGLAARWGLNEGAGAMVNDSSGNSVTGTVTGTGYSWVAGAPFDIVIDPPDAAPSDLTATASSAYQIDLAWQDYSSNEANFEVERSTGGSGGPFSLLTTLAANSEAYADTGLDPETEYCYQVRATNGAGNSAFTTVACATTLEEPTTVTVVFQDGLNGYAGTADTFLKQLAPAAPQGTGATVDWDTQETTGNPNTQKIGLVRFDNIFGSGSGQIPVGSTIVSAQLEYTVSNLGDPANVNEVMVDWSEATTTYNNFGGEAGVQDDEFGNLVASATAKPAGKYYIDVSTSVAAWAYGTSTNRGWIFRPTNTDGVQIASSEATTVSNRPLLRVVYDTTPPSPPAAPSGLGAAPGCSARIDLSWTDNSNNETDFEIERSTNGSGGPFSPLDTVGANITSYSDSGLALDTGYCYRVRATNSSGNSDYTSVACATTPTVEECALDFGAGSAYVTFGAPSQLGLGQFTIEGWFKREGAGVTTSTGTGGVTNSIPLITKGRGEADDDNRDMNYHLGIRASDNVLFADFEEGATGSDPGLNHPVIGVTPIINDTWYHVAATYDGSKWQLFLNGNLEAQLAVGYPPRSDSIQHAGLGTAMNSSGATEGHFDGVLDEVRIWNYARTQAEIRSTINSEITSAQTGVVARWGLDEGSGTTVSGSAGTTVNGGITGSGYSWVAGAPFNILINDPPNQPTTNSPSDGAPSVSTSPTLEVTVSDPEGQDMTVTFYGRAVTGGPLASGEDFTIVVLPDTQFYSQLYPSIFDSQTQWVVNNKDLLDIVYVAHEGDVVQNDGVLAEWQEARDAMYLLESPGEGIPYGVAVGNHDQTPIGDADGTTTYYNTYFGEAHFSGRSYYGGHYGSNNDNHYDLFSAGGMDFVVIFLEYDTSPDAAVLVWADGLLKADSDRRGIVVSHNLLGTGDPGSFSTQGQATYADLKDNPNLFLMLCGHTYGEGQRTDPYNGDTVYTLLADYQDYPSGGNGYLRILEFSPVNDEIHVKTYSPYLNQFETDANSEFTLTYDMGPDFQVIGTNTGVPSGSSTSVVWTNLAYTTQYEWYVTTNDGTSTTTSPVWTFTTQVPTAITLASFDVRSSAGLEASLAWPWLVGLVTLTAGTLWVGYRSRACRDTGAPSIDHPN